MPLLQATEFEIRLLYTEVLAPAVPAWQPLAMKKFIQFNIRIDEAMRDDIRDAAAREGCSQSEFARDAIQEKVEQAMLPPLVTRRLWFLPSWEGWGCHMTLHFHTHRSSPDGWDRTLCGGIRGVMLRPEEDDPYLELAMDHLSYQGVHILSQAQARQYMDCEGTYWSFKHGFACCPADLAPRQPSAMEWLSWMVMKPETPLFNRAGPKKIRTYAEA